MNDHMTTQLIKELRILNAWLKFQHVTIPSIEYSMTHPEPCKGEYSMPAMPQDVAYQVNYARKKFKKELEQLMES